MLNKFKLNEKNIELIMTIVFGTIGSLYVIYKISSSIFTVLIGFAILSFGLKMKDPEMGDNKQENHVEQLTIFSEEVLEPSAIVNNKIKKSKKIKA